MESLLCVKYYENSSGRVESQEDSPALWGWEEGGDISKRGDGCGRAPEDAGHGKRVLGGN